jgi:hypothetical protein
MAKIVTAKKEILFFMLKNVLIFEKGRWLCPPNTPKVNENEAGKKVQCQPHHTRRPNQQPAGSPGEALHEVGQQGGYDEGEDVVHYFLRSTIDPDMSTYLVLLTW